MMLSAILERAAAEGVNLTLSPAGTIKVIGEDAAVNRWLPLIREHKPSILMALQQSANDASITAAHETAIWGWLTHLEETDSATIDEVMEKCRTNPEALTYFLGRARKVQSLGKIGGAVVPIVRT